VFGLDILSFEGSLSWSGGVDAGHDHDHKGAKTPSCC
jgi:hypothetical protein